MVQEFIDYQRDVKGLSACTLENYRKDLQAWTLYAGKKGLTWRTTSKQDVDCWTAYMKDFGYSASTIKRRVEVLRLIYTWAEHEGMLTENPARYAQTPKAEKKLPKVVDAEKLRTYIDSEPSTGEGVVVRNLTALLLETGVRIGEALSITTDDIDRERRAIIIHGKGSKEREVYYGDRFAKVLDKWYQSRTGVLFPGEAIEYRYMMYRQMGHIFYRIHPHLIRHTFATEMLNAGMDLKTLASLLGHEHVQTTEIYAHVKSERTREIYNGTIH